jgi:GNAT superfamily N-acetyltransferase
MDRSRVYVMRERATIVAGLRLVFKRPPPEHRPWFTHVRRPVYLHDMAVLPARQRQGVGRACMEEAKRLVREWPADAIRLDAYDAPAGAGPFYRKCGLEECGKRLYFRAPIIYFEWVG